jgi:hypothetical protein
MADWKKVEQTLEQDTPEKKEPATAKKKTTKAVEKKADREASKAKKVVQKEKRKERMRIIRAQRRELAIELSKCA